MLNLQEYFNPQNEKIKMNYSTNTCQSCQVTVGGGRLLGLIHYYVWIEYFLYWGSFQKFRV